MFPPSSPRLHASNRLVNLAKQIYFAFTNGRSFVGTLLAIAYGAAPAFLWVFSFKHAGAIPHSWRPEIHTALLPHVDGVITSFFGTLLLTLCVLPAVHYLYSSSNTSSSHVWTDFFASKQRLAAYSVLAYPVTLSLLSWLGTTSVTDGKDLFAFASYGVLHFASPFLGGFFLWLWAPPGVAATFGWSLGFQNCASLFTHLIFPNAAPWFTDLYGEPPEPPPSYETLGNPAGLIRVDEILGINLYHKAFKKSPVVFGAIPSVHAGTAICCALYMSRYYNRAGTTAIMMYAAWMLWATMYLRHHWAIDLLAGSCYALSFFLLFRRTSLGRIDTEAIEKGSTNGWQRLILGYGSRLPSVLPTQNSSASESYDVLSTEEIDEELAKLER